MTFNEEQIKALMEPLSRGFVKERKQGNSKVSYIEGWHAIAEANRIFGFDTWSRETVMLTETSRDLVQLSGDRGPYEQWRVTYIARVRVTIGGLVREGTGFGSGMGKPEAIGDAIEGAVKEAETDAMKRALMTFGNPFGLALYDKTQASVADEPPPPSTYDRHHAAISEAADLGALKAAFDAAKADKTLTKDEAAALISAKEARKAALMPPPATLGEHLDNPQRQEQLQ